MSLILTLTLDQEYINNHTSYTTFDSQPLKHFALVPGDSGAGSVIEGSGSSAGEGGFIYTGKFENLTLNLKSCTDDVHR